MSMQAGSFFLVNLPSFPFHPHVTHALTSVFNLCLFALSLLPALFPPSPCLP